MKNVQLFYLQNCPHCKKAFMLIDKLKEAQPEFASVKITIIEESKQADLANTFDYFYVPTFYVDGKKVHEGAASEKDVKAVLELAVS